MLFFFSATYAEYPGTKPTLFSYLLSRSSRSSKKTPAGPKEDLRSMSDSHTKSHCRAKTRCYQLFGSKLFNNVKGVSTV